MKSKVILIGAIDEGNVPTNGETMKNQLFVKRYKQLFDKVISVDTLNWQRRPFLFFKMLFVLLFNRNASVIISASGAASYLISFLYYIPLKKNVFFWVVGGNLADSIKKNNYNLKALQHLKGILVQGKSMVLELNNIGLNNVKYVPNSKPIHSIIPSPKHSPIRFVFLSRIHPDKGIKEIIEAEEKLLESGLSDKFIIDFYGKIDPLYKEDFFSLIDKFPNISYKGVLNLLDIKGYKTLSEYDMMLFPTYWRGEGFPGIVIDAYMVGVPIIASDWNLNKEVVKHNVTGYIIPSHDSKMLTRYMLQLINNEISLEELKLNCLEAAKLFDYRNVLSPELFKSLEILK